MIEIVSEKSWILSGKQRSIVSIPSARSSMFTIEFQITPLKCGELALPQFRLFKSTASANAAWTPVNQSTISVECLSSAIFVSP
jgi:hypothetical protein